MLKPCLCGCGTEIPPNNKWGRPKRYVVGHNQRGHKRPGIKAGGWKGGRIIKPSGYVEIYVNGKHVSEHRWVYEQEHNCCLLRWSNVHHLDGNRSNNVWYNLCGMMGYHHARRHPPNRAAHICPACGARIFFYKGHKYGIRLADT